MELLLVRHGESQANTEGRMQGTLDSPLTELGREQARALGRWLAGQALGLDAAYCSPLSRAAETAAILGQALGLTPTPLPDLAEIDAGSLEGLDLAGIQAAHPSFLERDITRLGDFEEYGGEGYAAVQARVARLFEQLKAAHGGPPRALQAQQAAPTADAPPTADTPPTAHAPQRVLLVAHGGILFQLVKSLICRPVPSIAMLRYGNCTSTWVRLRERRGTLIGEVRWHLPLELIGGVERAPALGAFR
ncbi:MAG: histidine phosphatase family protein [Polyangiaceae bacterium]|nr:histidine phosphatase family protein [Polyangiaceae bacterium]MCW5791303.1 histidine phosphatase family protein [Polyangiaceae bacterium]